MRSSICFSCQHPLLVFVFIIQLKLQCKHARHLNRALLPAVSEAIKGVIDFQHEQHVESLTTARKMGAKAKEDDCILKFDYIHHLALINREHFEEH